MFKVLFPPFDITVEVDPKIHALLAYEGTRIDGSKKVHVLMRSLSRSIHNQEANILEMRQMADKLNKAPTTTLLKKELRSVQAFWQGHVDARERNRQRRSSCPSFRGHGGSGVDSYW